jgi:hypothetical protein
MTEQSHTPQPDTAAPTQQIPAEARNWAVICHLAGLAWVLWWLMPFFGGVIGSALAWHWKKHLHPFVDEQGKSALNFQITALIAWLASALLCFCGIGFFLIIGIAVVDLVQVVIASSKASKGESYQYRGAIHFID